MKLIFCIKTEIKVVYKVMLFFLFVAKYAQSTHSKFAVFFQHLKKDVGDVDYVHAYKHQEFLQVHNFFFGGCGIFKNRTRGPAIISSCFPSNFASYSIIYLLRKFRKIMWWKVFYEGKLLQAKFWESAQKEY